MPGALTGEVWSLGVAVVLLIGVLLFAGVYILSTAVSYSISQRLRTPPADLNQQVLGAIKRYKTWLSKQQIEPTSKSGTPLQPVTNNKTGQQPTGLEPFILLPSFGIKTAAVRRLLILASKVPAHYTTYHGNFRITIAGADALGEQAFTPVSDQATPKASSKPVKASPEATVPRKIIYGFFHPYASAGTNRERLLWTAVKATLEQSPNNICAIYTGQETLPPTTRKPKEGGNSPITKSGFKEVVDINKPDRILDLVEHQFGIKMSDPDRVVFIYLANRKLVDPAESYSKSKTGISNTWAIPFTTRLMQVFGSFFLVYEAVSILVPDVFIDTSGYPFAYPLVTWLLNVPTASYIHSPLMVTPKNYSEYYKGIPAGVVARNNPIWNVWMYVWWTVFGWVYMFAGSYVSVVMVNGSGTLERMRRQWWFGHDTKNKKDGDGIAVIKTVYPPSSLVTFKQSEESPSSIDRANDIVYLAQFLPEKRHEYVLSEFARFLKTFKESRSCDTEINNFNNHSINKKSPKLVFIGTLRNPSVYHKSINYNNIVSHTRAASLPINTQDIDDRLLIYSLRILANELNLQEGEDFEIILNQPFREVATYLTEKALFGIDATVGCGDMEQPGQAVVDYMASGVVPIVPGESINSCGDGDENHFKLNHSEKQEDEHHTITSSTTSTKLPGFQFSFKENNLSDHSQPSNAQTLPSLSDTLKIAFDLSPSSLADHSDQARAKAARFSESHFIYSWNNRIATLSELSVLRHKSRKATGLYD